MTLADDGISVAAPGGAAPDGAAPGEAAPDGAALNGVAWQKATFSNPSGNCVELARLSDGRVAVRNSRHPAGPALVYERAEIEAFLLGAKAGEFDGMLA